MKDAPMHRRDLITLVGGAAAAWLMSPPAWTSSRYVNMVGTAWRAARVVICTRRSSKNRPLPVVGLVHAQTADAAARNVAAFRKGLSETGYLEGQNVTVEYHWLQGQYERLPGADG